MTQENKINIAELLKDCPQDMELDCTKYSNVCFVGIDNDKKEPKIKLKIETFGTWCSELTLNKYGKESSHPNAKCLIFPKGKTTWEGFVPPCKFKDGDIINIITENNNEYITIFKDNTDKGIETYIDISIGNFKCSLLDSLFHTDNIKYQRLATEEEKQKLFDAIKANGYKWDAETKTLEELVESNEDVDDRVVMSDIYFDREYYADEVELHLNNYEIEIRDGKTYAIFKNQKTETLKPKFKVGDKVKKKDGIDSRLRTIESINNNYYAIKTPDCFDNCYITDKLYFSNQDNYELVLDKFDINTLKPFDKVLVRDSGETWCINLFGCDNKTDNQYNCIGNTDIGWDECIPYEGNEHLIGKTDDCDEYFKNW